ncbi:UGSC family (seleno)protein [Pseudochelatococcus sp. B33]
MNAHTPISPVVSELVETRTMASGLVALAGKTIGFVDNSKLNADLFLAQLREKLVAEHAIVEGPSIRKLAPKDRLKPTDIAALTQCDAVIQCFGDCGTSTSITVADAVAIEAHGVPTITVFSSAFIQAAKSQAAGRGMPSLRTVTIPHPMHTASRSDVVNRAAGAVPVLIRELTGEGTAPIQEEGAESGQAGLFADDQEMFFAQGWTDGLPVVIPTKDKIEAMLATVDRDPAAAIGPIPPGMKMGTIEKIAINAVMAGCKPTYFPVVLAALETALEDAFQLYSIQTATNTTTPLIIVNGPAVSAIGMNAGANVMGQGNRANATIGRALQLVLRNVGGDYPGLTDMSTHGQAGKFTACIAEAEADSPWDPLHVERGFKPGDSTVSLIGASAPQNVFTYGCENGAEIMEHFVGAMTALGHNNILFPSGPMLIISPEHAATLARDGYSKDKIRNIIFERARIPLSRLAARTVKGLHHRRSQWFETVGDHEHIGVADRPSDVHIVVAGGAGIHSLFVPTGFSYGMITRKIADPVSA